MRCTSVYALSMRRIVLAGVMLAVVGAAGCGSGSRTPTHTAAHTTLIPGSKLIRGSKRYKVTLGTEFDVKHHTPRATTKVSPAP
jgi:hypothetical protein